MKKMNKYHKLYEDIELVCLCIDAYEDAEEYLKPLRELINHHAVLEDAFARACSHIAYGNNAGEVDEDTECPGTVYAFTPRCCCNEDFCDGSNAECWKEWFLHLAKQENRN